MKYNYILKQLFSVSAMIATSVVAASSTTALATQDPTGNAIISTVATDSVFEATDSLSPGQIAVAAMAEEYKNLKELQYSGEEEAIYFPKLMEMYLTAIKALNLADDPEQTIQVKNILLDINTPLLKGAFFYSEAGEQRQLAKFARAYIDTQRLPVFADHEFKRDPRYFPTLVYVAASDSYNSGNYEPAKEYFEMYLAMGEEKMRRQVSTFMGQACINTKDYLKGLNVLSNAAVLYPDDYQIVATGIQCCIEGGYADRIQPLLDRAMLMKPGDEKLLNIQAQVYESTYDYRKALDIYNQIAELHPNSLENTQRIATCYFNLGVDYYNKSIMEENEKTAKKYRRQSRAYFESATQYLKEIVLTKPNDKQYLRALGIAYGCVDNKDKFDEINVRLQALGDSPMTPGSVPDIMNGPLGVRGGNNAVHSGMAAPSYEDFARAYIEERLGKWVLKGEFEKVEDYQKRVTEGEMEAEFRRLSALAEKAYLDKYAFTFVLRDLQLQPYDVSNETYLIKTPYGDATIKVPLKNKEAELFKSAWTNNNVDIRAPKYMIDNDHLALASVSFKTPAGKTYAYDAAKAAEYAGAPRVKVDLNTILERGLSDSGPGNTTKSHAETIIGKDSDVDVNIPAVGKKNEHAYAFIVANENYKNVSDVASALHDGNTFSLYCEKTLGIPKDRIIFLRNATNAEFWSELENLLGRIANNTDNVDVILYYSGHGLPDEKTTEAYLFPVDASPQSARTMIKLQEVYDAIGKLPNASLYAFMDACFSGSARVSGDKDIAIVAARGVARKHRETEPSGDVFVLSAASSQQTAFPYEEKDHGMFTYWLIKKLQDSKGKANLEEIAEFVKKNVGVTSREINRRDQTPTVQATGKLIGTWKNKRLCP